MKYKAIITSIFFIGTLFVGTVLADQGGLSGSQTPGARSGLFTDQDQQVSPYGHANRNQDEIASMHRSNDLLNKRIVSRQGQELGTIDNLVISEEGQVEFIILSRGGTMGMVAVPWEAANLQKAGDDQYRTDITEKEMEGAPTLEDYAQIATPDFEDQVRSYFGPERVSD